VTSLTLGVVLDQIVSALWVEDIATAMKTVVEGKTAAMTCAVHDVS